MSAVILACIVELNLAVMEAELTLLMVESSLTKPDRTTLTLSNPVVSGTIITYTTQLNSFGRSDSGNYTCTIDVRPKPTSTYLTGSGLLSSTAAVTIGKD